MLNRWLTKSEPGGLRWVASMAGGPLKKLIRSQQLLTIWRKAKGKECDALLWGDEVGMNGPWSDGHRYDQLTCT